jgi:hypothetical protein
MEKEPAKRAPSSRKKTVNTQRHRASEDPGSHHGITGAYTSARPWPINSSKEVVERATELVSAQLSEKLHIGPERTLKRYVIAIDYGTTFSAVAYAYAPERTADLNSVKVSNVRGYPSNGTGRSFDDQVPTVSLYIKRGERRYEWGNGVHRALHHPNSKIPANTPTIELVKLLLSNAKELSEKKARLQSNLNECGVSVTRAIADFLQEMWNNATARIALSDGESFFESCQKDLVLSVPPAWSANAVRVMQQAAALADLPEPEIVAEQEAAALLVLIEQGLSDRGNFQVIIFALYSLPRPLIIYFRLEISSWLSTQVAGLWYERIDSSLLQSRAKSSQDLAAYRLVQKHPFHVSEVSNAEGYYP